MIGGAGEDGDVEGCEFGGVAFVGVGLAFGLLGWIATPPVLFLIFASASVVAALVLRSVIGVRRGQVKKWDRDINE